MEINLRGLFYILPPSSNKWTYRNFKTDYEVK